MNSTCVAILTIILTGFLGQIYAQAGQVDPIGKLTSDFDLPTDGGIRLQTTPPASPVPCPNWQIMRTESSGIRGNTSMIEMECYYGTIN